MEGMGGIGYKEGALGINCRQTGVLNQTVMLSLHSFGVVNCRQTGVLNQTVMLSLQTVCSV